MITQEQIVDQVEREDIQPYLDSIYDENLPWSIVEQFRIAMMFIPPAAHGYPMVDVRETVSKNPDSITRRDLHMIINIIFAVPFASMYQTLEEGIEKTIEFDRIRIKFKKENDAFNRKIEAKKKRIWDLNGGGGNTIPLPNNLRSKR